MVQSREAEKMDEVMSLTMMNLEMEITKLKHDKRVCGRNSMNNEAIKNVSEGDKGGCGEETLRKR